MQQHGADATVFLDLEGVRLAARRQLLDMTWGPGVATIGEAL
ncbi:hypothetical protein Enr13x_01680 [Stieleria neptunia]|uniref:Uncharacterized protein n=1 Tax=Stieleria neptunia TaxID=2527979 RepID=A0A518HHQ4_9BACT|nr:hypothetical protein Enr13x_01680 [Stieleria neptunia]